MRYLAIGDGLCAGIGAPFLSPSFVYRHARKSEEVLKERVLVSTVARSNYRSKDILDLFENSNVISRIKESQLIVLSAGHQDFIDAMEKYKAEEKEDEFNESLRMSKGNTDDIIQKIRDVKAEENNKYILTILGLHNPYQNNEKAEKWIKQYNKHIECRCGPPYLNSLNLHDHFKGNEGTWCTRDRLYPNHLGHEEIAKQLHEIEYSPILSG
ncbi:GDSL-type esterase/lipase family protein [Heyndrickxia sp. NPDC080065]|uniref:GDSL-type esterase/lipase family protein n=1 Tax=Heyndrickxia sp. NPDC080065 TaxID=3390568 RepID=UPI003CFBEFCD